MQKSNPILLILFLALGIPMFYFIDGAIIIGGTGFMYHYLFGAGIILVFFVYFLLHPDVKLFKNLFIDSVALSTAYVVMVLWSFFIWSFKFEGMDTIVKAVFQNVYVMIAIFAAASSTYLFREKTVLYCTYAMSIANTIIIFPYFTSDPGGFVQELIELVKTFGDETGPLMKSIEIHDLTFAFGIVLLYALIKKDLYGRKQIIILTAIFSTTGLKRIAVAGIVLGYILYHLLMKVNKKWIYILCIIIIIASFTYLCAVHLGLFDLLESMGLDTKGRDLIYGYINTLFDISPTFLGNGLGFSSKKWNIPFYSSLVQDAYHNEFLKMYVELGFIGYFAWISLHLPFRIEYFYRMRGKFAGLIYMAISIYSYITYATDNTYYYYYMNFAVFVSMFNCLFSEEENCEENKKNKKTHKRFLFAGKE